MKSTNLDKYYNLIKENKIDLNNKFINDELCSFLYNDLNHTLIKQNKDCNVPIMHYFFSLNSDLFYSFIKLNKIDLEKTNFYDYYKKEGLTYSLINTIINNKMDISDLEIININKLNNNLDGDQIVIDKISNTNFERSSDFLYYFKIFNYFNILNKIFLINLFTFYDPGFLTQNMKKSLTLINEEDKEKIDKNRILENFNLEDKIYKFLWDAPRKHYSQEDIKKFTANNFFEQKNFKHIYFYSKKFKEFNFNQISEVYINNTNNFIIELKKNLTYNNYNNEFIEKFVLELSLYTTKQKENSSDKKDKFKI